MKTQLCNIVMLPTNEASRLHQQTPSMQNALTDLYYSPTSKIMERFKPQHLYITSNEEIKEGDWVFCNTIKSIYQWTATHMKLVINIPNSVKKIIATTDKYLKTGVYDKQGNHTSNYRLLPQIPESFVKAYVEAQGTTTSVNVEYIEEYWDFLAQEWTTYTHTPTNLQKRLRLKLREDNTVIISASKTFKREDLIAQMKACGEFGYLSGSMGYDEFVIARDKWIEQNL